MKPNNPTHRNPQSVNEVKIAKKYGADKVDLFWKEKIIIAYFPNRNLAMSFFEKMSWNELYLVELNSNAVKVTVI